MVTARGLMVEMARSCASRSISAFAMAESRAVFSRICTRTAVTFASAISRLHKIDGLAVPAATAKIKITPGSGKALPYFQTTKSFDYTQDRENYWLWKIKNKP